MRFISGMVNVPVVTVFDIELPEIIPVSIEDKTDALAGPPRNEPRSATATLINQLPPPARSRSAGRRRSPARSLASDESDRDRDGDLFFQ